jgi:hypothetical protein
MVDHQRAGEQATDQRTDPMNRGEDTVRRCWRAGAATLAT